MSSFKLHSEDSDFNNRVDALFNSLQTVAVDLESSQPPPGTGKRTWEEGPNEDEDIVGEHCGKIGHKFRRPIGLPPRSRGRGRQGSLGPRNSTPDYVKNPQNWTRYNMKDTKVSSDRENKQIGLELYEELCSRRREETREIDGEDNTCTKIVFKKPVKPAEEAPCKTNDNDDSQADATSVNAMFGGTKKFKMAEYEVGQSKRKSKSKVPKHLEGDECESKKDAVSLSYLMYEEEEEDD